MHSNLQLVFFIHLSASEFINAPVKNQPPAKNQKALAFCTK